MAKANLTLPDGTRVAIEGAPDEVAALLQRFSATEAPRRSSRRRRRAAAPARRAEAGEAHTKPKGPLDYIRELIHDEYFKTKRGLGEVRGKLEERGHIYPVTSISPTLVRLVRSRELRRISENKQWKYVNS